MTTLVSLEVTRRLKEQAELKQVQKYEMGLHQIERQEENYNKSTSASKDKYMIEALKKVKQSDVTFNNDYTDMTGSGLYNPRLKPKTLNDFDKQIMNDLETAYPNALPKKKKPKVVAAKTNQTKIQHESKELSYDLILEQLGRKRWKENPSSFFREVKEALIVKKGRLV